MNKKIKILHISFALIIFIPLFLITVFISPEEVKAFSIFSPFGGKVESWLPTAPACEPLLRSISVLSGFTVNITIEELKVGKPKGGTFGILRINGLTIPGLTTIYKHQGSYMIPGTWVLGLSIDICNVCNKITEGNKGLSFLKKICETEGVAEIIEVGCKALGEGCPINNLVYKIGAGLPSL